MEKGTLRRADMVMSIVIAGYAVFMFIMALKLQLRTLDKGKDWFQSAGLFPIIVSVLLLLCAVLLFSRARKDGARFDFITGEKIKGLAKSREFLVALGVVALLAVYIFILLPAKWINYEISTFLYLATFMILFNDKTVKKIAISVIISLIATVVITYGFGTLAMIPLP